MSFSWKHSRYQKSHLWGTWSALSRCISNVSVRRRGWSLDHPNLLEEPKVKETNKPTVSSIFLGAEPTLCFQDLAILLQFSRQSACHFAGALMAPVTQGRQAATWPEWAAIREQVLSCTGWRCQACGVRRRLEVHHVVKRSQAGS